MNDQVLNLSSHKTSTYMDPRENKKADVPTNKSTRPQKALSTQKAKFGKKGEQKAKKVINLSKGIVKLEDITPFLKNKDAKLGKERLKALVIENSGKYKDQANVTAQLIADKIEEYDDVFKKFDQARAESLAKEINIMLLRGVKESSVEPVKLPDVKIGNEFTFTSIGFLKVTDDSKKGFKNPNQDQVDKNDMDTYKKLVTEWKKIMSSYGMQAISSGKGKMDEEKIKYEFPLEKGGTWSYEVTLDQMCIEVITEAISASLMSEGEVANMMDYYIFDVAAKVGLKAHETVGGGHINIDRAGAFSEKNSLGKFLTAFYKNSAYWKNLDKDATNAPFPDELGISERELKEILGAKNETELMHNLNTRIFNKRHSTLKEDMARDEDLPHYQAVNLEHYDDDVEAQQRIEVRRVPAQKSREELVEQLVRIFKLMKGEDLSAPQSSTSGKQEVNQKKTGNKKYS